MRTDTTDYYRGREQRERQLAEHAPNPVVAAIHRQLADSYRRRVEQQDAPPQG